MAFYFFGKREEWCDEGREVERRENRKGVAEGKEGIAGFGDR